MLDLVCKSQRGNVFFYQKGGKKKKELVCFQSCPCHQPDSTGSAVQMRYITFKAGCSPGSLTLRKNERMGVCGSRSVGAGWLFGPMAPFSSAKLERRDKRGCARGRGHGKGVQQVAAFAALVMKCFSFQAPHTHAPVLPWCAAPEGRGCLSGVGCPAAPCTSLPGWC